MRFSYTAQRVIIISAYRSRKHVYQLLFPATERTNSLRDDVYSRRYEKWRVLVGNRRSPVLQTAIKYCIIRQARHNASGSVEEQRNVNKKKKKTGFQKSTWIFERLNRLITVKKNALCSLEKNFILDKISK